MIKPKIKNKEKSTIGETTATKTLLIKIPPSFRQNNISKKKISKCFQFLVLFEIKQEIFVTRGNNY